MHNKHSFQSDFIEAEAGEQRQATHTPAVKASTCPTQKNGMLRWFSLSEEKMKVVKAAEKGMTLMAFKGKQAPLKPACILTCFSSSG